MAGKTCNFQMNFAKRELSRSDDDAWRTVPNKDHHDDADSRICTSAFARRTRGNERTANEGDAVKAVPAEI